jgi:HAD superfamily hydrolase (TIGR01490 family)
MQKLALFDFDGTISNRDSFLEFIKFTHGSFKFYLGFFWLSPVLILFKLKCISNWKVKEIVVAYFYKGFTISKFSRLAAEFSDVIIPRIIKPEAQTKINFHKKEGHKIIVVSASFDLLLESFCKKNEIQLLATKLEIENSRITGKLQSRNCYGDEKVRRLKEVIDLKKIDFIYAYGDSRGDREMLALADEKHYRPF